VSFYKSSYSFNHAGTILNFTESSVGSLPYVFCPADISNAITSSAAAPLFQLAVAGKPHGVAPYAVTGLALASDEMIAEPPQSDENSLLLRYTHEELQLAVTVQLEMIPGTPVYRVYTSVTNTGNMPQTLTHLSSLHFTGIAAAGIRTWDDPSKVRLHYCNNTWEGEGQWRNASLEDLGLIRTSVHDCRNAIHINSVGSFSTARYLPMGMIEDLETGCVWFFQIEASSSWHYEIGYRKSEQGGSLFLHADAADERFGSWTHTLQPGETFEAAPAAVGCCMGGFNEAVRALTSYRRQKLLPAPAWEGACPVFFNDYMNCLWANPTDETLRPLIDAVAETGVDGFVIDAGWFAPRAGNWGMGLGDWNDSPDRFGPDGLPGIIQYIKSKGLIPGIWLEMEVCGEDAVLGKKPDSWFLRRNGYRVGGGARWFLDFRNPEVQSYLHERIDRLVKMGIGFIKNDYNECVGIGTDTTNGSPAHGLIEHSRAFYQFIDEVRTRHPQLVIENCGSGAMRQDYGILSHFHIQSSSDQEWYDKYPSIVMGSSAALLPEQMGIWSYPYPLLVSQKEQPDILDSKEYRECMADGEQTIFNMVTGMCGNMYLSGRIDKTDALNRKLIIEGISVYKAEREHIHNSYPFHPCTQPRFMDDQAWAGLGLANETNDRILLAVWRLKSPESYWEFHFPAWANCNVSVEQRYPNNMPEASWHWNSGNAKLTVHLPKQNQARLLELTII